MRQFGSAIEIPLPAERGLRSPDAGAPGIWYNGLRVKRFLHPLAIAAIVLVAGIGASACWFKSKTADVTDPRRYAEILSELGYPKPRQLDIPTIAHFPPTIPAFATRVRLFYRPHYLQGPTQLQLRFQLPPAEVAAILPVVQPAAKEVHAGGSSTSAMNAGAGTVPSAAFRNAANTGYDLDGLSADFQVFILDAATTSAWNHGYTYGVALSQKSGEVIYWLEDW